MAVGAHQPDVGVRPTDVNANGIDVRHGQSF